MTIDELTIIVRVVADGVKQGVAAAKSSLGELQAEKSKLTDDLNFKIKSLGLESLTADLKALQAEKSSLEAEITIKVKGEGVAAATKELSALESAKSALERKLLIETDTSALGALKDKLAEVVEKKSEASKKLKMDSSGVNDAAARLRDVTKELQGAEKSAGGLNTRLAAISVAAGIAFAKIAGGVRAAISAHNEFTGVMASLESQMKSIGENTADAFDIVREKSSDGLISPADTAAAVKNLTIYGYSLEETAQLIDRLKDSAAHNRQSHYTLGEAVRATTEGIRMENSVLSDAAGVTKNIAKMYEEYADSVGKTAQSLTQAEKAQAVFNGVMAETEAFAGSAARYAQTLAGSQGQLAEAWTGLAASLGGAAAPALKTFIDSITPAVRGIAQFISENKELVITLASFVTGALGAAAAASGLAAAIKLISTALNALGLSAGPAGWVIVGFAAIAAIIANVATKSGEAAAKQRELDEAYKELLELSRSETNSENIDDKRSRVKAIEGEISALEGLRDEYEALSETREREEAAMLAALAAAAESGAAPASATDDYIEQGKKIAEMWEALAEKAGTYGAVIDKNGDFEKELAKVQSAAKAARVELSADIANYTKSLRDEAAAQQNLEESEAERAKALEELAVAYSSLESSYKTLSKGELLSLDSMLKLTAAHPALAEYIRRTGDATFRNGEIIKEVAKADAEATLARLANDKALTEQSIQNARNRMNVLKAEIIALQSLYGEVNNSKASRSRNREYNALSDSIKENGKALEEISRQSAVVQAVLDNIGDFGVSAGAASASKASAAAKAQKEENKALEDALRLLSDKKDLTEMAAKDEFDALERIAAQYAKTASEQTDIAKRQYALRRRMLDDEHNAELDAIVKSASGAAQNIDYASIISRLNAFKDRALDAYADYPQRLKEIFEDADEAILESARKRADKLVEIDMKSISKRTRGDELNTDFTARIADLEAEAERVRGLYAEAMGGLTDAEKWKLSADMAKHLAEISKEIEDLEERRSNKLVRMAAKEVDALIEQRRRLIDLQKSMDGLEVGGDTYKYSAVAEAADMKRIIEINDARIAEFEKLKAAGKRLTDAEFSEYQSRISDRESFNRRMTDLGVEHLKQVQRAEDESRKKRDKADEDAAKRREKIARETTKVYTDEIKKRYDAQIKLAEEAAESEIAIYRDKIAEIDSILKSEDRADTDAEQLDRIRRLQEQLKYEADDSNKYELSKQIQNEQADFDKRKRRESLEDEKSALSERLSAVRDDLANRKKLLGEQRDAEIAAAEDSYNRFVEALNRKNAAEQTVIAEETAEIRTLLGIREKDNAQSLDKLKKQEIRSQGERFEEVKKGMINTIDYLRLQLAEFADLGRQAGRAWADAYKAEVSAISESIGGSGAVSVTNNYSLNSTYNQPVASPYKQAAQVLAMLEAATRFA